MHQEAGRNELAFKAAGSILAHEAWTLTLGGKVKLLNVFSVLFLFLEIQRRHVLLSVLIYFTLGSVVYPIVSNCFMAIYYTPNPPTQTLSV